MVDQWLKDAIDEMQEDGLQDQADLAGFHGAGGTDFVVMAEGVIDLWQRAIEIFKKHKK